jgi:hypothetical protein
MNSGPLEEPIITAGYGMRGYSETIYWDTASARTRLSCCGGTASASRSGVQEVLDSCR